MADTPIPVADLPKVAPGTLDSLVGVDESTGEARRFGLGDLPASAAQAAQLQTYVDAAEAARDAAMASGDIYATTAAGLDATTSGQYFSVPSADSAEYLILYKNNAGSALEVKRYPSAARADAIEDADRSNCSYRIESFGASTVAKMTAEHLAGGSMASLSYSAVSGGMQIASTSSSIYYVVSTPYPRLPGIMRAKLTAQCTAISGSSVQFGIAVGPSAGTRRSYLYGSTGVITTSEGTTVQTVHQAASAATAFTVGDTVSVELEWDSTGAGTLTITLPAGGKAAFPVTGVPTTGIVWTAIRGQGTGKYTALRVERMNALETDRVAAAEARATELTSTNRNELFALRSLLANLAIADPSGFSGLTRAFSIYRQGGGKFFTNFDLEQVLPFTVAQATSVFYVDSATGSDSNPGSAALPFKSIYAAIHNKSGNVLVYVKPGNYFGNDSWRDANATATKLIVRPNGAGRIVCSRHQTGLSWSLAAGQAKTYQATITSVGSVVDTTNENADGDFVRLDLLASIAAVEAQAGSYYVNGTTIYLHTHNDRAPDSSVYVFLAARNGKYQVDSGVAWIEGIDFYAGQHPFHQATVASGTTNTVYFKDCSFKYSGGVTTSAKNGFSSTGKCLTVMQGCVAAQNLLDGFNYHESAVAGGPPTAVEIGCIGRANGFDTGGTNNGSTIHDGGTIIRINGYYHDNQDRDIHDVNNARSWNLGCRIGGAPVAVASGAAAGDTTKTWLDECTIVGSATAMTTVISGSDAAIIYTSGCTITGATEAGSNVSSYTP